MTRPSLLKTLTWCLAVTPAAWAAFCGLTHALGANPIERLINRAGFWTLTFLVASLVPTAVKIVTGRKELLKVRRLLGLTAFAYACAHLVLYAVVDQALDFNDIWQDLEKRNFITVGMAAFLLLVPLAVTSTNGWVRRLGGVGWQRLHRLVYLAAGLGVVHFLGRVKADYSEPGLFGAAVALLLFIRALGAVKKPGA